MQHAAGEGSTKVNKTDGFISRSAPKYLVTVSLSIDFLALKVKRTHTVVEVVVLVVRLVSI